MEQYVIKGGNPLVGEVEIAGAKNAALAILSAAIMTDETILIENLPDVRDINVLLEAIAGIGAQVDRIDKSTVKINGSTIGDVSVDYEYIKKIRASYYLLGALLGKYKRAEVPLPGGCNIGSRPIDQHLKGFRALGAKVDILHGAIVAEAANLHGSHIFLDVVSVGATINIMMAASLAPGRTIIENAAREPHVVDVANFLNSMGANIKGAGTDVIRIKGVEKLHRTEYSIIPDQIEAGTFMFAAAATGGDVTVRNVIPKHLEATTAKLEEIGCEVQEFDDAVRVRAVNRLHRTHVKTLPYPGYPTDMQPQIAVTLALAEGTSIVTESIFENRFKYADELSINKKEFLDCIDRATLLVREGDKKPIIIHITDNNMELKIDSAMGSMNEDIDIEKEGKDILIGFNPKFLIDALKVIDDEMIDIYLVNPKAPCFIRDEEETYTYLILPVNINQNQAR